MKDIDLNDVRIFAVVGQEGTLTAAGKKLHLPPSTISRSLTRLERHLGGLLIRRSPRGFTLTEAGKSYLASCRRALQVMNEAREVLHDDRDKPQGLSVWRAQLRCCAPSLVPCCRSF